MDDVQTYAFGRGESQAPMMLSGLDRLGEKLGISKERVRQIENRALQKLRSALLREHEPAVFLG